MSNKNYKPLQLIKNGGLKQALEEGATEIVPLQQPEETPSEGVQSNVQMIEKITENFVKSLETICDRIVEIICWVENIEVETKLNKEDADLRWRMVLIQVIPGLGIYLDPLYLFHCYIYQHVHLHSLDPCNIALIRMF